MAMLAVAWIAGRFQEPRKYLYGYNTTPHSKAVAAALLWRLYDDPTDGAWHIISRVDLKNPEVRKFTTDRSPPIVIYECGPDALYVFK